MIRVLFVTTGLSTGGAEKQLARLLGSFDEGEIAPAVASLAAPGPVSAQIEALGVPVWHLGLDNPLRLLWAAIGLVSITSRFQPDVVQGWMYHGNLAAHFAAWLTEKPVVWGIRQSLYDLRREKTLTRAVIRLGTRLSSRVAAIVYNAEVSRTQHQALGYARDRACVIGNGFDGDEWHPDDDARRDVRAELGVPTNTPLIGLIARYHPMKGHDVFLKAADRLAAARADVHFLLAGRGITAANPTLGMRANSGPLAGRLHLLDERADIPRLTAALDIASSSSSWGEAFSNAIAEALLCGVPVVATEVGDARNIVGDAGVVVPPGDVGALADAWQYLLDGGLAARQAIGRAGRERLLAAHSLKSVADTYLQLYREIQDLWTKT